MQVIDRISNLDKQQKLMVISAVVALAILVAFLWPSGPKFNDNFEDAPFVKKKIDREFVESASLLSNINPDERNRLLEEYKQPYNYEAKASKLSPVGSGKFNARQAEKKFRKARNLWVAHPGINPNEAYNKSKALAMSTWGPEAGVPEINDEDIEEQKLFGQVIKNFQSQVEQIRTHKDMERPEKEVALKKLFAELRQILRSKYDGEDD